MPSTFRCLGLTTAWLAACGPQETALVGCSPTEVALEKDGAELLPEAVNPDASEKARQVLGLLYELPGRADHRVLSGQTLHVFVGGGYEFAPGSPHPQCETNACTGGLNPRIDDRIQDIHEQTGIWVGIVGAEYTDWFPGNGIMSAEVNPTLIEHSNRGGIAELHFHPRNPAGPHIGEHGTWAGWWGPSGGGAEVSADLILDPGPVHDSWMTLLSAAADGLEELRDNDVVVLWRPFHGRDAGSWWWSYQNLTTEDYSRMWAHMVDYFSRERGLDNILYVQSWYFATPTAWGAPPLAEMWAGAENVDVVGVDHCEWSGIDYADEYAQLSGLGKPFGVTECSPDQSAGTGDYDMHRVIDHVRDNWPGMSFFNMFDYDHDVPWADMVRMDIAGNLGGLELLTDPWVVNAGALFPAACEADCSATSCGAPDPDCGAPCGTACDPGCTDHCDNGAQDCAETGLDCGDGTCADCSPSDEREANRCFSDAVWTEVSCSDGCGCLSCWNQIGDDWTEVPCPATCSDDCEC